MDVEAKSAIEIVERLRKDSIEAEKRAMERKKISEQEELEQKKVAAERAKVVQLPLWPESARGVPNSILRGSLFAAIQEKNAKTVRRMVLHDNENLKIVYTGRRLTQSDLDVWEYALHLAKQQNLGHQIYFTERSFLKGIDRKTSKYEYGWLKKVISDLSATNVEIQHNGHVYGGSLVDEYFRDEHTGRYCITINPRIARLYDAGHTYINWEERKLLGKRKPLAQWLHGYISSHKTWVPHKISTIKSYSGSETREERKFKQSLKDALALLKGKHLIKDWTIDSENLVHITLVNS